ncbi:rod shape-determining protein MreC [Flavobacteriaceae bacterium AU392]|nr:rod shape-determining protein MreC [Flavobacteriaceae bacterium]RKM81504.1 rod shape-determining protein MreC [Flavobacteriaceae bacterium AU392]
MQQIINFIIRNKVFILFLLLFGIALSLTFQSHSYHKSKFINSANFLTGGVYGTVSSIGDYFNLKNENKILLEENNRLKSILFNTKGDDLNDSIIKIDSTSTYKLTSAKVYSHSYSSLNNYLLINKGKRDSIKEDYGVITSKGIIGIIDNTSKKYSRVISILNSNSRINAQLKNTNHFGVLKWDGKFPNIVQLEDVPKQAEIDLNIGDSIITGGFSTIFPKGIGIGSISSFELDETENYYTIQVNLFNDMTNIGHVYIIENRDAKEISTLNDQDE